MLIGSHCPYCPTVLRGLSELVKTGVVGKLEAVNMNSIQKLPMHWGCDRFHGYVGLNWRDCVREGTAGMATPSEAGLSLISLNSFPQKNDRTIKLIQENPAALNALLLSPNPRRNSTPHRHHAIIGPA
jgi:hypothetical protein